MMIINNWFAKNGLKMMLIEEFLYLCVLCTVYPNHKDVLLGLRSQYDVGLTTIFYYKKMFVQSGLDLSIFDRRLE
jgi:hypothetical protein